MNTARRLLVGLAALMVVAGCSGPTLRVPTAHRPSPAAARPTPSTSAVPIAGSGGRTTGTIAGSGALAQFQDQLRNLADSFLPSIVQITTESGLGSGIVFDSKGDIVTNNHVVQGAKTFTVTASNGKQQPATLIGSYPNNDLAVIHVAATADLRPATFADASQVRVGDIVIAVGSPFGLGDTVTEGIISATGRTQSEGGSGVVLNGLLQTTAPINPGNSGGALVDIEGRVVGIPTLSGSDSRAPSQGSRGIGFAINANQVTTVAVQLIAGGSVTHTGVAYLGVTTRTSTAGGAGVLSVGAASPAEKAGIKVGWTITAVGERGVPDTAGLSQALSIYRPGDRVRLSVTLADGTTRTISVTLGERPVAP